MNPPNSEIAVKFYSSTLLVSFLVATSALANGPSRASVLGKKTASAQKKWRPAPGPLLTRWGERVTPDNAHREYPRPQMVRSDWINLNGLWEYAIRPKDDPQPKMFDGHILVPFCAESQLSGVGKTVTPKDRLWYRKTFNAPKMPKGQRLLLHFGAVDWHVIVWINGKKVGEHKGGYDPFEFDITDAINSEGENEIVLSVWDPTDTESFPRGKQTLNPRGIWYTAVTGVWQTVWLEQVPSAYIRRLRVLPDVDNNVVHITVETKGGAKNLRALVHVHAVTLRDKTTPIEILKSAGQPNQRQTVSIKQPRLWSPEKPWLYQMNVSLVDKNGKTVDKVSSYFGMRKMEVGKDQFGRHRLLLNGKVLFQYGTLDQGWWPDGLYTPPSDEALRYDIEVTKRFGFNMIRKHVTTEPARWYYWCDKLGVLVWQDMPNAMRNARGAEHVQPNAANDLQRDKEAAQQFETELKAMIDALHNHPSIVMWVPFNEGWGQYDTTRIARWTKRYDPSRLVTCPSGWTDRGVGDVFDIHNYPGPAIEIDKTPRAPVLGEFGGLGWPVKGHLWATKKNWGYRTYETREKLNQEYAKLLKALRGPIARGCAAAIYTQTTDVEGEVNGLMTYDRKVIKLDEKPGRKLANALYKTTGKAFDLVSASNYKPHQWRVATEAAPDDWASLEFDDSTWREKAAPFQGGKNPFIPKGSTWDGGEIWMRRTFDAESKPRELWLQIYHNVAEFEVFINGKSLGKFDDVRPTHRHYQHIYIDATSLPLRKGRNVIAVHAVKRKGARALDVGLYTVQR